MRDDRTVSHPQWDVETQVTGCEVRWTLRPKTNLEDIRGEELLELTPAELLAYAADCRADLRAVRETLQQALTLVTTQQEQLARAARMVESQRQQLRFQRPQAAA